MRHRRLTLSVAVLLTLLGGEIAVAQNCPADSIEISRVQSARQLRLNCKCRLGFVRKPGEKTCARYIPESDIKKGTRFAVIRKSGTVRALIRSGSPPNVRTYEVDPDQMMSANQISTGANSHLVVQLPGGKRVAFGPNSSIMLGDPLDEFDLNLLSMSGVMRLDVPKSKSSLRKLQEFSRYALGYSRAFVRKASQRHRVRTPDACACVRGTDFVIRGKDNGLTVQVIEGVVDLVPHRGKPGATVLLRAGEQGRIGKDGKLDKLDKLAGSTGQHFAGDWASETGLASIPTFGE